MVLMTDLSEPIAECSQNSANSSISQEKFGCGCVDETALAPTNKPILEQKSVCVNSILFEFTNFTH